MAKVIMPPQINSLDELLNLMVDPQKGIAYLKQLKDARDTITAKLSTIQTVEQADDYLVQAREKDARAQTALDRANEKEMEAAKAGQAMLDQLKKDQDAWTVAREHEYAAMKGREQGLSQRSSALDKREQDLMVRELSLREQDAVLARLSAKLNAEHEKMNKRKELLNAI